MIDVDKLAVVRRFLEDGFPGCAIREKKEAEGYALHVSVRGATYIVVLTHEFVGSHTTPEIEPKLARYTLVEHLRDLPDTPILVTNSGLKLEYE